MTMEIHRVTLIEIALPLREPFVTAGATMDTRRLLLTQLEDAEGRCVWGECAALDTSHYLPETIDSAREAIRESLAGLLLSRSFDSPSDVSEFFDSEVPGNAMAKAALEMPMWTLAAVQEGTSLARYIGGKRRTVGTGIAIGLQKDPDTLAKKVESALWQGYKRVKLKIEPGRDIEFVEAAARVAGGGQIQLDANCAYTLDDVEMFQKIDALRVMMIEQPLPWDDLEGHAELQKRITTPICLDESLDGPDTVRQMIAMDAGRIVCLKPGRVGGIEASLSIHDLCRAKRVPLWIGGMLESGIGRAYTVALASKSAVTLPGDLSPSARYWERDIVRPEWEMTASGEVEVPRGAPGLGVEVDTDRIDSLTISREDFTRN